MRRRRFLGLGATFLAGLGGCLSADRPAGGTTDASPTPTSSPTATATEPPEDGTALTATATALQPGVVEMTSPDSIGVRDGAGSQFLYLHAAAAGDEAPARGDLRLRFDGGRYRPIGDDRRLWRGYNDAPGRYDAAAGEGWLLFELPATGDPGDLALVWGGGEAGVADDVAGSLSARLANPAPPLSLALAVPDSLEVGQTPELEFSVTNGGERAGRFVAGLNRTGPQIAYAPIAAVSRPVPAGETATWSVRDTLSLERPGPDDLGDGEPDMVYRLDWAGGSRSHRVRLLAPGSARGAARRRRSP